jgi:glutamate--cysteine ligase
VPEASALNNKFAERIDRLAASGDSGVLAGGLKGIEKESLRVTADGSLSEFTHPAALGSALTNSYITTDFSEALLEFVTPAFTSTWEALGFLCDIHQFTYERLGSELLWVSSMPCSIPTGRRVPLARYGTSNVGRMKTAYRNGLGYSPASISITRCRRSSGLCIRTRNETSKKAMYSGPPPISA